MSDLVERLREAESRTEAFFLADLLNEAADALEPHRFTDWRAAYWQLAQGNPVEVRLQGGDLDEIVGYGVFHIEQMDDELWFFDLGGCRFHVAGKVDMRLIESDSWEDERARVGNGGT